MPKLLNTPPPTILSHGSHVILVLFSTAIYRCISKTIQLRTAVRGYSLQFYCNCLSMTHIIDQQNILFYKHILPSSNVILRTLFRFKQSDICALLAKYRIPSLTLPVHVGKNYIWNHCVSKAIDAGHLTF